MNKLDDYATNLKRDIRDTKREIKERGLRIVSCFNGGLSGDEYRLNARLYELKTRLNDERRMR
jgi:hypothetical protein